MGFFIKNAQFLPYDAETEFRILSQALCWFRGNTTFLPCFTVVNVPVFFASDGASIPKILWPLLRPWDLHYMAAAVIHDYHYMMQFLKRKEADKLMLECMKDLDCPFWKRQIIYTGVRIGGWKAWRKHQSINSLDNFRRHIIECKGIDVTKIYKQLKESKYDRIFQTNV